MSDTPRTDAAEIPVEIVHQDGHTDGWIETEFARQLERELNSVKAIAESLAQALERLKALYESEQDGGDNGEFINRPDWIRAPLAAWRIAKGAEGLE